MSDVLPSSLISLTSSLKRLGLGECELQGEFPTEMLNLLGQLPSTLFNLTQLIHLDLSFNSLEGPLPTQVSGLQNLEEFRMTHNLLSGAIPSCLFTLPSLEYLGLSRNRTTGPINQIQKPNSVQRVFLANNDIHGSIFKWESEGWQQLVTLNLSHNLQTSFEQFPGKNFRILDLRSDLLQGPLLAPPPSLLEFFMSKDQLTGEIPPFIYNMTALETLDLSRNYLGGIIPACLGNFSYILSTINLQMNNFHGKIPPNF
ncbi:MDIS1-interacting receptor like kinase 2-like [Durio zibethinus]|uniref:MDIS1-interacting receptor like kinase 2-like n=1 Tax=Durio zibethinus TaxID=66656 RepID=A0A6P5WNQ6_DURZI|nr:MDIS1-interacting receptor like kinase 2-like [Durio zibethinus]